MKKFVTLLTTGLLTVMLSTTVFAETKPDVWHTDNRETDTKYSVSIEANGKVADGVIEIKFDEAALTCEEDSVAFVEFVDMHSVNVEEGCVKISYLSAEAIPEGKFIVVSFDVKEAYADEDVTVTVTSVAHNETGEALVTGEYHEPETEGPGAGEPGTEGSGAAEPDSEETEEEETETEETEEAEVEETENTETEETEDTETEDSEEAKDTEKKEDGKKENVTYISGQVSIDTDSASGWQKVIANLANISENGTMEIFMNHATIVPKDFLEALKGQNKTAVFVMNNGIKWSIHGTSITGEVKDIDLGAVISSANIPAEIVSSLANGRTYTEISLSYDGEFGCCAVMTISLGVENAGKYANLYYYNPTTGKMEFVTSAQIAADGSASLTFTHASDYVVIIDTVAVKSVATGDNIYAVAGILVLCVGLMVVALAFRKKKGQ